MKVLFFHNAQHLHFFSWNTYEIPAYMMVLKYSWPLNNTGINFRMICSPLSVSTVPLNPQVQPQIISTIVFTVEKYPHISVIQTHIVQASTVLRQSGKRRQEDKILKSITMLHILITNLKYTNTETYTFFFFLIFTMALFLIISS